MIRVVILLLVQSDPIQNQAQYVAYFSLNSFLNNSFAQKLTR